MNKQKGIIGFGAWGIAILCLIMSTKWKTDQYLGDTVFGMIEMNYNIIIVVIIFIVSIWIFNDTFKNNKSILLNWLRLSVSVMILISFISILIF